MAERRPPGGGPAQLVGIGQLKPLSGGAALELASLVVADSARCGPGWPRLAGWPLLRCAVLCCAVLCASWLCSRLQVLHGMHAARMLVDALMLCSCPSITPCHALTIRRGRRGQGVGTALIGALVRRAAGQPVYLTTISQRAELYRR